MEAILIYNQKARNAGSVTPEELQEALLKAGYNPVYKATSSQEELDDALKDVEGLVVAVGGDGTLRAVATRLVGRKNTALSFIPLGTANNIARTFGITETPLEIITGLKDPLRRSFDIGYMQGPWGEDFFVEGAGWGLFADALADYDPQQGKNIPRTLGTIIKTLTSYRVYDCQMTLDGRDFSGAYILVQALNTISIGPHLKLAPNANPGDGLLDFIRIRNDREEGMLDYLTGLIIGDLTDLSSVEVTPGQRLEAEWAGFDCHADDEVRPLRPPLGVVQEPALGYRPTLRGSTLNKVVIEVWPDALELWLPNPSLLTR